MALKHKHNLPIFRLKGNLVGLIKIKGVSFLCCFAFKFIENWIVKQR